MLCREIYLWMSIGHACVFCAGTSKALAQDQSEPADRVEVRFPSDLDLGSYTVLAKNQPARLTQKEQFIAIRNAASRPKLIGGPVQGSINYAKGAGIGLVITGDSDGSLDSKLNLLAPFPSADIRAIMYNGPADLKAVKILERFQNLKDLSLSASDTWESTEGCKSLERLQDLEAIELYGDDDCVFGSSKFCTTVLKLKRLRFLSIPCGKLTTADIAELAAHQSLEQVYLHSRRPVCGSQALQCLNRMPKLRELAVVCTNDITDADVMGFTEIKSLEFLSIKTDAPLTCQERFKARHPDCQLYIGELPDDLAK